MLSLQTLTTIEALLMSKSDPRWGEFMVLAQVISEVQQVKQQLQAQSRAQPASPRLTPVQGTVDPDLTHLVPGPREPATPLGHKEAG